MNGDILSGKALLSYLRYNFKISEENLNALGFDRTFDEDDAVSIADMAKPANKELLYEIGYKASSAIRPEHFSRF